ncbi:P-loop containing nucleoside triphosphate hydrolase protein [Lasiosphaeris hirsuta]|uniref:P-loop containing nucleoside triphosphate hydrolase protein n=1 Tax=Lasiosphaeris hirsuta TaxID=260670 RepID=A0AA40AY46_9PEZI|nr:P-loop containing nucleoside triphosphate hydrolase protein [Lasiosphaeris hirsuta]
MAEDETTNGVAPSCKVLEYSDEVHAEQPEDLVIGEHGYKYRLVEGRVMPPYITPARYALSRSIATRPTDICFVSYPKSGSTWLSYILVLLTGGGDTATAPTGATTLRNSLHWVESSWTYPRTAAELEAAPAPRIFKSHMPYDMALGGDPARQPCRYIYVARNPKDVCASYYHFESCKSWSGYYQGGWDHWLAMFAAGKVQRGDWFDHALGWWARSRDNAAAGGAENILFVTYEDLLADTRAQLSRIAAFLGVAADDARLAEVERASGFREMQTTEFSALRDVKEFNRFFRKGCVGSWKESFTVAQSEAFDRLYRERTAGSGLELRFE